MRRLLIALLVLLTVAYLGINAVGLPPLLVAENLALAAAYAALALALARRWSRTSLIILLLLLAFNAGRVSRSVWSPTTGWGPLALEHVPLLAYLLLLSILTAVALARQ